MFDLVLRRMTEQRRKAIRENMAREHDITICLRTARWSGDDYLDDPNGYGHVSGEEDLYDGDQDDCELWFDITQGGIGDDGDGLTYWQECGPGNAGAYGTDPTDPSSPGWVGYYVDTELFSELQSGSPDLRTYSLKMGEYAELGTKIISGTWTSAVQVKANIKANYLNGMVGAVLVGDMPMAFIDEGYLPGLPGQDPTTSSGALSSLFYEDMDGTWVDSNQNGLYEIPINDIANARENDPEIFIGLLRPPTSSDDLDEMAIYLNNYFSRALDYTYGVWFGRSAACIIDSGWYNLDTTIIKENLITNYAPYGNDNSLMVDKSTYYLNPSTNEALGLPSQAIRNPPYPSYHFNFCVIVGHSDYNGIFINSNADSIHPPDLTQLKISVPFTFMTCCRTTRFIERDGSDNIGTGNLEGYYYLAGYFSFNNVGWGLGCFGYSSVAGGGAPGSQGFFNTLNLEKSIGESLISWGTTWSELPNPVGDYSVESDGGAGWYFEHYYLNYIGDPLLKS